MDAGFLLAMFSPTAASKKAVFLGGGLRGWKDGMSRGGVGG